MPHHETWRRTFWSACSSAAAADIIICVVLLCRLRGTVHVNQFLDSGGWGIRALCTKRGWEFKEAQLHSRLCRPRAPKTSQWDTGSVRSAKSQTKANFVLSIMPSRMVILGGTVRSLDSPGTKVCNHLALGRSLSAVLLLTCRN